MTPHAHVQSHPSTAIHARRVEQGGAVFCVYPDHGRVQATVRASGRIDLWINGDWASAHGLSDRQEAGIRARYAAIR